MAKRLIDKKIAIDVMITSPANRALTTANYFADGYALKKGQLAIIRKLYHARSAIFYNVVSEIDDVITSAAVFSHNPGITDFVNELTTTKIDNMPTCGIFAIKADIDSWKDFKTAKKTFWFFDYPKM